MKIDVARQFFVKVPSTKFHENLHGDPRPVTSVQIANGHHERPSNCMLKKPVVGARSGLKWLDLRISLRFEWRFTCFGMLRHFVGEVSPTSPRTWTIWCTWDYLMDWDCLMDLDYLILKMKVVHSKRR